MSDRGRLDALEWFRAEFVNNGASTEAWILVEAVRHILEHLIERDGAANDGG